MSDSLKSKEIGERCRRFRMANKWSQKDLADRIHTTSQNISKYEKEGISNIDTIEELSKALGKNLLEDEIDTEGSIGEIGKEILRVLIKEKGSMLVTDIVEKYMYGMTEERVTTEILKLEMIGMVVREQYTSWDETEKDRLFIRAKGIIAYKNTITSKDDSEIAIVKSYEMLLRGKYSYQEYIDDNLGEKLIRQIAFKGEEKTGYRTNYRANYIYWLRHNFISELDKKDYHEKTSKSIPEVNFYHDIIYRMALDIRDCVLTTNCTVYEANDVVCDELEKELDEINQLIPNTNKLLDKEFDSVWDFYYKSDLNSFEWSSNFDENIIDCSDIAQYAESELGVFANVLFKILDGVESRYPTKWYSDEEIENFIDKNCGPAETDEEKEIDDILSRINELIPETKKYYTFPYQWEINGLAKKVRNNYKL